jgi:DNA-binding MarR family transcriptional regulator
MSYTAHQKAFQDHSTAPQHKLEAVGLRKKPSGQEDPNADKLITLERRFSYLAVEVGRLTSALGETVRDDETEAVLGGRLPEGDLKAAGQVNKIIKARRSRANYFRDDLFADPAWDILLDLARAELEGQRVSVTGLCSAASVPPTTALRWITILLDKGVLARRNDPLDGRRKFVELTASASASMQQYLSRLRAPDLKQ